MTRDLSAVPAAKVTRPRLAAVIARAHALALLRGARKSRIVWVSGPAGHGKTILVLSWLKQTRRPVIWIQLDSADRDPGVFLAGLGAGFLAAFPRVRLTIPTVPSAAPFDAGPFTQTFVTALAVQVGRPFVIVLDDLHVLDHGVSAALDALAAAMPRGSQLVGVSRADLPSVWARWEASREVYRLPPAVLPFSSQEVQALYHDVFRVPISDEDARSLQRTTAGWPVGLVLLERAIRANGVRAALVCASAQGAVSEYFAREVFLRLDQPVRTLLTATAVVEAFSLSYAKCVDPCPGLDLRMKAIQDHALVSEIPTPSGTQFRYHPLVRAFLQEAVDALPECERLALLDRVEAALAEDGDTIQLIEVLLRHHRPDRAASLIKEIGLGIAFSGQRDTLRRWLGAIPSAMREQDPWLCHLYGRAVEFYEPCEADAWYRRALAGFEQTGDVDGQLATLGALLMTHLYLGQDYGVAVGYARKVRGLLRGQGGSPMARASALFGLAFTDLVALARVPESLKKFLWAAELASRHHAPALRAAALSHATLALTYMGQIERAREVFACLDAMGSSAATDPGLQAQVLIFRGLFESLIGENRTAAATLASAQRVCQDNGLRNILTIAQLNLGRARVLTGDLTVLGLVDLARERAVLAKDRFFAGLGSYVHGLAALMSDRPKDAVHHALEGIRLNTECHAPLFRGWHFYLMGVGQLESGSLDLSELSLRRAAEIFQGAGTPALEFWPRLQLARVAVDQGDLIRARERLAAAMRMGRELGVVECEALRQSAKARLLGLARQWGIEPEYTQRLAARWSVWPLMPVSIRTLGRLEVWVNGRSLDPKDWKAQRPQRLVLAVLAAGGRDVPKERIMDWLWPEAEGDRAVWNFHTTLRRAQTMFKGTASHTGPILRLKDGHVSIDPTAVWSDCCAFEDAVGHARRALAEGRTEDFNQALRHARELYQGDFLFELGSDPWVVRRRSNLRRHFAWVQEQGEQPGTV